MPTKQETFDTVVAHLRKQGKPAWDGEQCCYRTPDGLKCAAGCLIPDEDYDPDWEGDSVERPSIAGLMRRLRHSSTLVRDLQYAHDTWACNASGASDIEKYLSKVAREHRLTYTPPEVA